MSPTWRRGPKPAPEDDPAAAVRRVIVRLTEQREAAMRGAAGAIVNQSHVNRALLEQRARLELARTDVQISVDAAQQVADVALARDGAVAANPYLVHVDGLRRQAEVLDVAADQITGMQSTSDGQTQRARQLLREATATLDGAVREQLRLLIAIERLERQRAILAARSRRLDE